MDMSIIEALIENECENLKHMLLRKNRKYGNSALEPKRIFSQANAIEQIRVRIDDKLSRLHAGSPEEDEDVVLDLLGYLILLRVAWMKAGEGATRRAKSDVKEGWEDYGVPGCQNVNEQGAGCLRFQGHEGRCTY
jgi:hypothetical protein